MSAEDFRRGKHHVRPVGDEFAPKFPARITYWNGHKLERAASGICTDIEDSAAGIAGRSRVMIGVIFVTIFPRSDQLKFTGWLAGAREADFAGGMARAGQKQKNVAAAPLHFNAEAFVRFFVEQRVR